MGKQIYFEDIEVGTEIPSLQRQPNTVTLVKWAGATEDYYPIHFDKDIALANKLPGVIVHGRLKAAYLGELVTNWIGDQGFLKKLSCNYRGMDLHSTLLTCKGRVTRTYTLDGENLVDADIWLQNEKGETTTPGTATVSLPSRKKKKKK